MNKTFTIHEQNRYKAIEIIEKLNKKFTKNNIPLIEYKFSDEKNQFDCYELNIEYKDIPTINGEEYSYLGSILEEDGTKQFNGFDEETSMIVRKMDCKCDLCKKEIYRNNFIVFKNIKTTEIKMFGSTCAKEFFPFDPNYYLGNLFYSFDLLTELDEDMIIDSDGSFHCGGKRYVHIDRLIDTLKEASNDFTKWVSRENAELYDTNSTKEDVLDLLYGNIK